MAVGCEAVEEVEKTYCIDVVVKLEDEVDINFIESVCQGIVQYLRLLVKG